MRPTLPLLSAALATAALAAFAPVTSAAPLPSPSAFLHLEIGADRVLADYRQIRAYFAELDRLSPRVQVQTLGKSTLGEDMVMAVITSEANQARLPRLKEIAKQLADPRGRTDAEIAALAEEGRAFLLITCNIHATEIGSTQMAMEWAHALASAEDAETKRRLDEVVLLLVPSLNPDGQIMETEWYRQWLGTPYEGGRQPRLYHHYVGHDNNRDWYMLTQAETKAMTRAVYHEWFPQVWLDEHQMGTTGPRLFMPPYAEPVDADIHPLVWREVNRMGADMALRLEQAGKSGVIYGYAFDAYWPGGTKNTAWFKNISGLLTEVASCRLATPLYVDPSELAGGRKGLVDYEAQTNFPNPWPGGWWRLRDIMDYERIASDAILESCANLRRDVLRDVATRARAAVTQAPPGDGFRIPGAQRDRATAWKLAALLVEHGVEVYRVNDGDLWVPLAQPYGDFVREMLTTQRYPEVKLVAGKDIVRPYDVAAWSLPLMMGVEVVRENRRVSAVAPPRFVPGERRAARAPGQAALPPDSPAAGARAPRRAACSGGRVTVLDRDAGEAWPAARRGSTRRPRRRPTPRCRRASRSPTRRPRPWRDAAPSPCRASRSTRASPRRWTRAGRAGCSSRTASSPSPSATRSCRRAACARRSTRSCCPTCPRRRSRPARRGARTAAPATSRTCPPASGAGSRPPASRR